MNLILQALKHCSALTVAVGYMLDDGLKMIWQGRVPTKNGLYLAYDPSKVSIEQVKLMERVCI
ncbi:hypothetical protein [Chitinophaga qingshengii]|uniref:Uncharacterized protein n=1 Tax=Chitinophaga qingshengii TaxID=1569794 RepID=A0ABR7TMR2_9BACT|nr:hypothetical protein [Chitinophaga qingshengii]MBC9931771.1 hypothetical protein [Chitinophaga qingshengii]